MEQVIPATADVDEIIEVSNSDSDQDDANTELEGMDVTVIWSLPAPEISACQTAGPKEEKLLALPFKLSLLEVSSYMGYHN